MAVGRHHAHVLGPQDQQGAVQEVARVFARDRELGLGDHLPRDVAGQGRVPGAAAVRHGRKIVPRHGLQPRLEAVGRHLDAVLVLLDEDVGIGQGLDDFEELLGGQRQRPGLLDLGRAPALQPDFEVGCRQADLRALGVDQDVGEDGNRVLALDDALEELQFPQQIRLANGEFHACAALESRTGGTEPAACPCPRAGRIVFKNESTNTKV